MTLWVYSFQYTIPGIFPELFLFLALSVILLFGAFAREGSSNVNIKYPVLVIRPLTYVRIYVLFLTFCLVYYSPFEYISFFNNSLLLDNFISLRKILLLILSSCIL